MRELRSYNIWTIGCQMNVADSERLESAMSQMGLTPAESAQEALALDREAWAQRLALAQHTDERPEPTVAEEVVPPVARPAGAAAPSRRGAVARTTIRSAARAIKAITTVACSAA